jgi:hypothetical protein
MKGENVTHYQATLIIPTRPNDNGNEWHTSMTQEAYDEACNRLLHHILNNVGGYTAYHSCGAWRDAKGDDRHEESITLIIAWSSDDEAAVFCMSDMRRNVAAGLEQDAVFMTVVETKEEAVQ